MDYTQNAELLERKEKLSYLFPDTMIENIMLLVTDYYCTDAAGERGVPRASYMLNQIINFANHTRTCPYYCGTIERYSKIIELYWYLDGWAWTFEKDREGTSLTTRYLLYPIEEEE